jgi:hypothetical protein
MKPMGKRNRVGIAAVGLLGVLSFAQEYQGPRPEKPDVPYLLHAENLIETEVGEARMEERKKEAAHILAGANSPVRTPLAEPIFLFLSDKIRPEKLGLYKLEVGRGQREIAFPNNPRDLIRRGPRPLHLTVKNLGDNLYWIEVNEYLEDGEYCLSPSGSQSVFCFQVY